MFDYFTGVYLFESLTYGGDEICLVGEAIELL